MLKIRLKRMGTKKKPFFHIIVTDGRNKRDGRSIERVGYYDPLKKIPGEEGHIKINEERFAYWFNNGAVYSEAVRKLLKNKGILRNFAKRQPQEVKAD